MRFGQLVEREAAQEAADAGDARVAGETGVPTPDRVVAGVHRAQLVEVELVAVAPDAARQVEHRPARVELDRDRGERQQRRGDHERDGDRRSTEVERRAAHRCVPSGLLPRAGGAEADAVTEAERRSRR